MTKKEKAVEGNERIAALLNRIMEYELAGVVRYTHYSLMVFGYNRLPIISWLSGQADESLAHAHKAGEMITHIGGHPSLDIGPLLETHKHDIGDILRESLEHEAAALQLYRDLFKEVEGVSVMLEEYARKMIYTEELHQGEVDKMLRKPGDVSVFSTSAISPLLLALLDPYGEPHSKAGYAKIKQTVWKRLRLSGDNRGSSFQRCLSILAQDAGCDDAIVVAGFAMARLDQ